MEEIKKLFINNFKHNPTYYGECGGRFEILGNHTDHNHGLCLAATCSLCIKAYISKSDKNIVNFSSLDYGSFKVDLSDLSIHKGENKSAAMIRGIAKYYIDHNYKIGGFNIASISTIFPGAGLSSSAAFELLIARIFNDLFNDGKIDELAMCKAGQYSENHYFGKKSGLLDQIGVCYGAINKINFNNIEQPEITTLTLPFKDLHFVSVNTGGSHENLNDLYSSIPNDMFNASKKMGHNYLSECSYEQLNNFNNLTDREKSMATHFFTENKNVEIACTAIKNNDEKLFLEMVNNSRISSTKNLQNMMVNNNYVGSPLEACDIAMKAMNNEGACKINGGGFAGSIICLVPEKHLNNFLCVLSKRYGKDNVKEIQVRNEKVFVKNINN